MAESARAEKLLQLSAVELQCLLDGAGRAFSRAAAQGASSGTLAERLLAAGASEQLAGAYAAAWKAGSPALLAALRAADWGCADRLLSVSWRVAVPVATDGSATTAAAAAKPLAVLELELGRSGGAGSGRRVACELSHEQLGALFDDLERINAQLDALASTA